jgi:putative DNA primase/helicase
LELDEYTGVPSCDEPEAIYTYTDGVGALLFQVLRYPGKLFLQRQPGPQATWINNVKGVKRVLYNLPDVISAKTVIIVEGEKDADNLKAAFGEDYDHLHLAVTTAPMGAGNWLDQYSPYLTGKNVLIFPDNDEAGRLHAQQAAVSIANSAHSVKIVELPGLQDKEDVSDFLKARSANDLLEIATTAPLWEPSITAKPSNTTVKSKAAVEITITTLASVKACEVDWLWEPYLAMGTLAMLSGDHGIGKTFLALAISAALTVGETPCTKQARVPTDVLYLTVENSPEHVLRPRFDKLGGDPNKFHVVTDPLKLSNIPSLAKALQKTKATLMVVDPIQSFLGADVDAHRANETRPILDDLSRLAKEYGCCILLLRHLSKAPTGRAIYRGLGSIDFTGAVRTELLAGCSSRDAKEYALVQEKSNLGDKGVSLGYTIGAQGFSWTGESKLTAIDLLSPETSGTAGAAASEAKAFLLDALTPGPRAASDLFVEAHQLGISTITLKRAKAALKVESTKSSLKEGWKWSLPKGDQSAPYTQTVIPFEQSKGIPKEDPSAPLH